MVDWIKLTDEELNASVALKQSWQKHCEKKKVPAVNLPALARRDAPFMSTWAADPGYHFVSCDFTSLEPCITAHFSNDPYYMYAVYTGVGKRPYINDAGVLMIDDIYLMTASVMPGVSDTIIAFFRNSDNCDAWLKDSESIKGHKLIKPIRSKAKTACLGFGYGMGPKKFVKQAYESGLNVSLQDARGMFAAYWELFARVRDLSKKLEALVKKNGFFINPMGYRMTPEPHKAFNAFIQSTASGVLDLLCLEFFAACPEARFVAMVHDEVIFQIPSAMLDGALKIKNECVVKLNKTLGWSVDMRLGWQPARTFAEVK